MALVFNLFGTWGPLSALVISSPWIRREERGKPYSFCEGQLSNCLILRNKAFEFRKQNLAVNFEPAKLLCIQVALLFPCCVVLVSHLTSVKWLWNWTLHCLWWGGRKEQWDFPGNSRKCSCLAGSSLLARHAYPLLALNSSDNRAVTLCSGSDQAILINGDHFPF